MQIEEFRNNGYKLIDWIADYYENIEELPVKSAVKPREVFNSIPHTAPEQENNFDDILADFDSNIL